MKVWFNKFKIRIKVCWRILTRKYNHWIILNLDDDNIVKLLKDEDFDLDGQYHGLQPYVCNRMIQQYASNLDEVDMICQKAEFQANAELHSKSKESNQPPH